MRPPAWTSQAEKTLREASARVRMIYATTPIDLPAELCRLEAKWSAGDPCAPRFSFPALQDLGELIRSLERLAEWLLGEGPFGAIHADRARELADEAAVCAAVGTRHFRELARKRFSWRDAFDDGADALVKDWLSEPFDERLPRKADLFRSDDPSDPRSLLVRLRAEIGARKLPFRVVVVRDSSALAATGEGFVQIGADRMLTVDDVERTVLHEIEGHVVPRCRANAQRIGIFALGTRFGIDDQEGRALWFERQAGVLGPRRRRELAWRHSACRMLEDDADFVETARTLMRLGASIPDALRITARVFRGGGLGREVVYVPAFLRVASALAADPTLDDVLGAGRVSVDAADILRPWVNEMH
ncbi:MAG: DUF1704 domain-containing protein [Polyangiaceae bacterium]|nr:DUF1704 domain-containing protein [Polyangiaceae bacterium]